jgi:3-hydroxyisobutyrate dehydrogenase-like beta-hydroxyacid dehydrogenase
MTAIGLVGVGVIGKLYLDRLLAAGHEVVVFDVDPDQVSHATDEGAEAAGDPADLARRTDAVLMAVPGSPEVEATVEGTGEDEGDGLLDGLDEGQLVIDSTTTRPETSVVCEERCDEVGADFLEAPITGGAPREGYHVMVGGTESRYEAASEVLDAIADDHTLVGGVPDATVLKLGLQLRYAGQHAVDAEVVEFVRDNGVDPALFRDFFGFDVFDGYFSGDFSQDIDGLGGLAIWHKDIGYARAFARQHGTALPLAGVVHEAYKATTRRADRDEGHASALVKYWLALNDAEDRYE